ncbi:MAG: PDZ domain-containing protein [Planctomycetota bacterium]
MSPLVFRIDVRTPATHRLRVALEFDVADQAGSIELFLPTWTPGSYLIREYSRQLGRVLAADAHTAAALGCEKTAKNRFRVQFPTATRRVCVTYEVYAHELTVRTADVTADHAYWNNACVLLWPVGERARRAEIHVLMPAEWLAVSGMAEAASGPGGVTWVATDLDEAIDSPCLLGRFERLTVDACGMRHEVVLDGLDGIAAPATLGRDLAAIIAAAAAVFGGTLPYASYKFLCLFTDEGNGGLEHATCCTVLTSRTALANGKSYRDFVSLCAHELFHAWNQKRMRPVEQWTHDYEVENYTSMLWLGEGWTAYYDDLLCCRAGVMTPEQYLDILASNIDRVRNAPGRFALSLAESSHDAWIRLYRPDENTRNSSQNYYVNGSVAALCLDLDLRGRSQGRNGLDDVLRALYRQTFLAGRGYERADVERCLAEFGGEEAVALLRRLVDGPFDPDLAPALAALGVRCTTKNEDKIQLGVVFASGSTKIAAVLDGTAAARAGLAPGDEILGLQGLRVTDGSWGDVLRSVARPGEELEVLLSRRGAIRTLHVTPEQGLGSVALSLDPDADATVRQLRESWLGKPGQPASTQPRA